MKDPKPQKHHRLQEGCQAEEREVTVRLETEKPNLGGDIITSDSRLIPTPLSLRPTQYNGAQPPRHFQEEIMGHHSGAQAGTCKIWEVSAWEGFTEREPRSKGVCPRNTE